MLITLPLAPPVEQERFRPFLRLRELLFPPSRSYYFPQSLSPFLHRGSSLSVERISIVDSGDTCFSVIEQLAHHESINPQAAKVRGKSPAQVVDAPRGNRRCEPLLGKVPPQAVLLGP
jgi:hypothetical protein